MATFDTLLRPLRKARGLTQEKAARRMGLTRSTLNGYENGLRTPGYDLAIKICRFYDVPFDYFSDDDEVKSHENITIADVWERAKDLGVNPTQLAAASGISYNTIRLALSDNKKQTYLSEKNLQKLMETLEDFDFTVFPNYRKPIQEEGEGQ